MKRDVGVEFFRWKERKDRKPLVLMGARQVGKTWLMENFGRENFSKVHFFDCQRYSTADFGICTVCT